MSKQEVWVHEISGLPEQCSVNEQTITRAVQGFGSGNIVRYVPAPVWHEFDSRQPEGDQYWCEAVVYGCRLLCVCERRRGTSPGSEYWEAVGVGDGRSIPVARILRYTDMLRPPKAEYWKSIGGWRRGDLLTRSVALDEIDEDPPRNCTGCGCVVVDDDPPICCDCEPPEDD